ncbi:MAG: DUF222 domain-containing protein [Microthrixaceae bacterium]
MFQTTADAIDDIDRATRGSASVDGSSTVHDSSTVHGSSTDCETDLMDAVLAIEALSRRLDATKATLIGRLDASGATVKEAGLPTKQWKANRTHGAPGVVGRELRVARTLRRFDSFAAALREGRIGTEHVLALANACNVRIEPALVELQDELAKFASQHRFTVFQRHLRNLVALLDADGPEPDCGDRDTAQMAADGAGNLLLSLELSGHNAIVAERIIRDETNRQYRAAVREQEACGVDIPTMAVLRARAILEVLRRGAKVNPQSPKPAVEAILPITVDRRGRPTGIHSVDGRQLDDVSAAVLICDAHLQPVVVDSSGTPLNHGRTRRLFNAAQRRAMIVRDGGCVFPGCDAPVAHCDAHHLVPFGQGGPTDVDQGAMLCRRHHGLVHSSEPWRLAVTTLGELSDELDGLHRRRAASADLVPSEHVFTWSTPGGGTVLAQNAIDHRGPAPPHRRTAA